jgi:hypothetical protein
LIALNQIGSEGAKAIGNALEKNTTLTTLDLCSLYLLEIALNQIINDGTADISEKLYKITTNLTNLNLSNRYLLYSFEQNRI